jgi:cellulose synthase/poly-beta-1,6-N-acetylglucosamine synthase-like glycosyltransferase
MHDFVLKLFDYANLIILLYFIVANVVYTLLMVISLYSVTLHAKFAGHYGHDDIVNSPVAPPIALIIPAFNEEDGIVGTVMSVLELNYPEKEIIVVDDGSTDNTLRKLINTFQLQPMSLVYRPVLKATEPHSFYHNPNRPELLVVCKDNGGKPDAVNVGINLARSPYFCTVDADSIIERDALLRLIAPVFHSSDNVIVSGGIVRISNGCHIVNGKVKEIDMPATWIERCQIVEYLRTFLFGRPAWSFMGATFITSGAFCMLHRETVVLAGGFSRDTVTEDIDIIATMHEFLRKKKWKYRMVFTTDPVCWTECPRTIDMLKRQRRRWQMGLMQTVMKHNHMIFNPRYRMLGMLSMPFHAYIEAIGCLVESAGMILVPFSFLVGAMPLSLFLLIVFLAIGYGTLLSVGSVLLQETTLRRYPYPRHIVTLVVYAVLENLGYRQMVTFFRAQGVMRYILGTRGWEVVTKSGVSMTKTEKAAQP